MHRLKIDCLYKNIRYIVVINEGNQYGKYMIHVFNDVNEYQLCYIYMYVYIIHNMLVDKILTLQSFLTKLYAMSDTPKNLTKRNWKTKSKIMILNIYIYIFKYNLK